MSSENPYEYNQGSNDRPSYWEHTSDSGGVSNIEPRTPFKLYLNQGFFVKKLFAMEVKQDHLEIGAAHLSEPIILDRSAAKDSIKFKMTKLIVKTPERKYKFGFQKSLDKELQCGRLDVWANGEPTSDPEIEMKKVESSMIKFNIWITWSNLVTLGILNLIGTVAVLFFFAYSLASGEFNTDPDEMTFTVVFMVILAAVLGLFLLVNFGCAILLAKRQPWALWVVTVFYGLFLAPSFLQFNILGILIGIIMVFQSVKAGNAINRQKQQMLAENQEIFTASSVPQYAPKPPDSPGDL